MTGPGYRRWYERATVLAGKGATGLLPVAMLALCGRMSGAAGLGRFAIAFSLAQSVAELSDFASQRHVSRLQLNAGEDNQPVRNRLEAFNGLRLLTFAGGAAVAAVGLAILVPPPYLAAGFAALASALWLFLNNTSYASAFAAGRFFLLAAGPWLGLVVGVAISLAVWRVAPGLGVWAVVAGLHAGKAAETALTWRVVGWPRAAFEWPALRSEWASTRHLMMVGLVSAANARLLIPLAGAAVGVVGAGYLSVGLNLQAAVLLLGVAVSVPAFRAAVDRPGAIGPREAFHAASRDWYTAITLSAAVAVAFVLVAGRATALFIGQPNVDAAFTVAVVVICAPLETLSIFAGVFYHAARQDERYFRLSAVSTAAALTIVGVGGWSGGVRGAAWAFLVSRVLSAAILNVPLLPLRRSPRFSRGVA